MLDRMPDVMVSVFKEELHCSIWCDYYCKARTLKGLIRILSREVKSGRIGGYRLIRKEFEVSGVCPAQEKEFIEKAVRR